MRRVRKVKEFSGEEDSLLHLDDHLDDHQSAPRMCKGEGS